MGGAKISLTGELSIGLFILSMGLTILHSHGWILVCISAWITGFISNMRTNRRHRAEKEALRAKNAANYPGVFDTPPPQDIEGAGGDQFDLYDTDTCTYIGKASKQDLRILIERFGYLSEQGSNDIFILVECLEMLSDNSISDEFSTVLRNTFKKHDSLVIRWIPSLPQNG
jgi:hypothetical protein